MFLKRRIITALFSVLFFVAMISIGIVLSVLFPVKAQKNERPIIIVDAGHGGLTNTTH